MALLQQGRPVVTRSVRVIHFSPERPITATASHRGGGSASPGSSQSVSPPVPTYLGYLSGAINSLLQGSKTLGRTNTAPEAKPNVVQSTASGSPVKAVNAERVIERKISRTEVTTKTHALVKRLLIAESAPSRLLRLQDLSQHILNFPPTRVVAAQNSVLIANLLHWERSDSVADSPLRAEARQCLTLCGYQPRLKSKGVNLLCIDGGGTRGMMGLAVLEEIERISGKKISELFDHIAGVSTGGIIACLLGIKGYSVQHTRDIYMEISRKLFSQNKLQGSFGLLKSHSYYDTTKWIQILKEIIGEEETLIETSKKPAVPRLSLVASIVNLPRLEPYVFRNYEHPSGRDSHYRGGSSHCMWTAIQASAAAPMYFEEVQLGDILLQDGGVIANNPTAIAIHETKLLWPDEQLHCVVSVGNGRSVVDLEPAPTYKSTSLQNKLNRIIDSATDTEAVHMSMDDLLDHSVYYRLNPYMTFPYGLDEIDPERLEQMQTDAVLYVRRNKAKIEEAALRLIEQPTLFQTASRNFEDFRNRQGYYSAK